jgi:hypothetical protein
MIVRRGMTGDTVRQIQQRLQQAGALKGPVDGDFGGGSEAAVKSFQKSQGLNPSGAVDAQTWEKLFPGQAAPVNPLVSAPLINRCLALTGSFETGKQPPDCFCGITGDFDGQGISFGVLQWNIGQNSLQDLLKEAFDQHTAVCQDVFHEHFDTVRALGTSPIAQQLDFARSIQTRGVVQEPWMGMLKTLGRTPEFQDVQVQHARKKYNTAVQLCAEYQLESERATALMFDIVTQNGSIGPIVKAQILADYASIPAGSSEASEVARMQSIANRRAAAARTEFINDVRIRKLTIAEGTGTVHGIFYDLEETFGITLKRRSATD